MPREKQRAPGVPRVLQAMAWVMVAFLLVAAIYACYLILQVLLPKNTYETALLAVVSDTVEADGVLLFEESYIAGAGELGYLVEDGERVSAGTAVAEIYTNASQAALRQELTQLEEQITLLQKSQNTATLQLDMFLKERSAAVYDLLDTLDQGDYDTVVDGENAYLLAQNKLWIVTGDAADFTEQIAVLTRQMQSVQTQLGTPAQIKANSTGYFVRSTVSGRLNASATDILALDAQQLKAYLDSEPEVALEGYAGKLVSGFSWQYVGVCTAEQGQKLLAADGKPLSKAVSIRFPGRMERALKATITQVQIDPENGLARFVLSCNAVNGDVLQLNHASAQIIVGETEGLLVPAAAVRYQKEELADPQTQGENYIPGVYVKYGNIARFCRIDPVDEEHPLIQQDEYILVLPKGTSGSVSQVRLYDEIIVSGKNLYDGKLL